MAIRRYFLICGAWALLMCAGCSEIETNHPHMVMERCEVCHGMPPNDSTAEMRVHYYHLNFEGLKCWNCHLNCDTIMIRSTVEITTVIPKIVKDTMYPILVWTHDSLHRNGRIDLDSNSRQCRLCHDYRRCDKCHGVPPNNVSNPISQRVHGVHVTRQGFGCDTCHKGYNPKSGTVPVVRKGMTLETTHHNGVKDVIFNVKKKPGRTEVAFYDSAAKTCNNLYCHGATTLGGKPSVAINEVMPQDSTRCGFCHNLNVLLTQGPVHSVGSHAVLFSDCLNCHPEFRLKTFAANSSTHRNVVLDTIPCTKCDECHSYPHACVR